MEAQVEKILNIYHLEIVLDDRNTQWQIGQICPRRGKEVMSTDTTTVSLTAAPWTFKPDLKQVIKTHEN